MARGSFTCGKCGRQFSMAAHLARHMSTTHAGGAKAAPAMRMGKKLGKRKGVRKGKKRGPIGRPRSYSGVKLGELSLEQLGQLISGARAEARRKIGAFEDALG